MLVFSGDDNSAEGPNGGLPFLSCVPRYHVATATAVLKCAIVRAQRINSFYSKHTSYTCATMVMPRISFTVYCILLLVARVV